MLGYFRVEGLGYFRGRIATKAQVQSCGSRFEASAARDQCAEPEKWTFRDSTVLRAGSSCIIVCIAWKHVGPFPEVRRSIADSYIGPA